MFTSIILAYLLVGIYLAIDTFVAYRKDFIELFWSGPLGAVGSIWIIITVIFGWLLIQLFHKA